MTRKKTPDRGDALINAASALLAFACAFFAGLMIRDRQHLEDVRLAEARTTRIVTPQAQIAALAAENEVTGAIDPLPSRLRLRNGTHPPAAPSFELLAVVDGVAFVAIGGPQGEEIWPVGEGSVLPGAGRVLSISQNQNRWQLTTSRMTISGARQ
jgi:hypothetical protein